MNKDCNDYYQDGIKLPMNEAIGYPINELTFNGEILNVIEFGITSSPDCEMTGVLLFFAYKELKRLSQKVKELEEKMSER